MNTKIISLLKACGVEFAPGLAPDEMEKIEKTYGIQFPKSLRIFLMEALPVSTGFYNWRDFQPTNVRRIKQVMDLPVKQIRECAQEVEWNEEWGEEPDSGADREQVVRKRLECAPRLLPVYAHRYIPVMESDDPPIISVHDTDVIYYGKNLADYFEVEFGKKKHGEIKALRMEQIPFWSEIM